jgi:hypothetical protein
MSKKKSPGSVSKYIPKLGLSLAKYSGEQLIDRVGQDIIKNVVASILCGGNVRALTEDIFINKSFHVNNNLLTR